MLLDKKWECFYCAVKSACEFHVKKEIFTSPCSSSLPCAELRCLPWQGRPGRTGQYPTQTENMMFYIPKSRSCSLLCQLHWSNNYSDLLNTCRGGKDSPNAEVQIRFTVAQIKETRGSHISILGCSLRMQEFSKGNKKIQGLNCHH